MTWISPHSPKAIRYFEKNPQEGEFIKYLGDLFQVTSADKFNNGRSEYSYFFLKAYKRPAEKYNLNNEILAFYSPYGELQARTLSDLANLQHKHKERVHPIWTILITEDPAIEENFQKITEGKDLEIYCIPFSRQELEAKPDAEYIHKRIEKYLHGRDLFAVQSALQYDTFFFGRQDLINEIVGQLQGGQNFGLFGLRKIGKTSVLFAVRRQLNRLNDYRVLHIDCQSPKVYLRKWDSLLAWITEELTNTPVIYKTPAETVDAFEKAVHNSDKKVVLIFDEIENVSVDICTAEHWNNDFLHFWGAIRAVHQTTGGKLLFGVAGVNPHIFEKPLINGKDNPILFGVSPQYLWPLSQDSVKEMVRTIGRYMHINFESPVYQWLFEQYGGHPFLVRKACSLIYQKIRKKSLDFSLAEFTSRQKWLDSQIGQDVTKILIVLAHHYPSEYDDLLALASGQHAWLQLVQEEDPKLLMHIKEYRIIEENNSEIRFTIKSMERYLIENGRDLKDAMATMANSTMPTDYDALPAPDDMAMWTRIGQARNKVEPMLRQVLLRALTFRYGPKALQRVMDRLGADRQATLMGHNLGEIFSGTSKSLFLSDLTNLGLKEWELVMHVFQNDKKAFQWRMNLLNSTGRADAHANSVTLKEVEQVEAVASELMEQMSGYLE